MIPEKIAVAILTELCEEKKEIWKQEFLNDNDRNVFNTCLLFLPEEFNRRIEGIGKIKEEGENG